MINLTSTDYGYKIVFQGDITIEELNNWIKESEVVLQDPKSNFGCLIDMQDLNNVSSQAYKLITEGQKLYISKGMVRSAVILNNPEITKQYRIIAKQSGEYKYEKYIDALSRSNWEIIAVEWITSGIDL
jgi:hypothetical protein